MSNMFAIVGWITSTTMFVTLYKASFIHAAIISLTIQIGLTLIIVIIEKIDGMNGE